MYPSTAEKKIELQECITGFTGKTLEECIEKIAEAKYRESLCKGPTGRKALMFNYKAGI